MLVSKPFSLKKKSLSLYIRNGCERQCRLSLYSTSQLKQLGMPPKQDVRAGLGAVGEAGDDYQDKVVSQVATIFGATNVRCSPQTQPGKNRPQTILLADHIASLQAHQFVVESRFSPTPNFIQALQFPDLRDENGLSLEWSDLNPDIILVGPARRDSPAACEHAVSAAGTLNRLADDDSRLQLRVIDVKLASEPGAHYFAEVVYYSMALAAWLEHEGYANHFVVVANGAVWPGSYENSALWLRHIEGVRSGLPAPTEELIAAMQVDLEEAEFSVYGPRVRRFLRDDLTRLITTPWQGLPWHVHFRCGGCDFLGYDWGIPGKPPSPLHCWQAAAATDHLSRIYGLSKAGSAILQSVAPTVQALAQLDPAHPVLRSHSTLRAKKDVLLARAASLATGAAGGIAGSGASAVIPSYADLKIFVTLDYDPSSAITVALSLRASWLEPRPFGSDRARAEKRWGDKSNGYLVNIVDEQSLDAEEREFVRFLKTIKGILQEVRELDEVRLATGQSLADQSGEKNQEKRSTYQIYLWDNAQFRHLTRLVSRYLTAIVNDPELRDLAWLFPPPELLPDPDAATRHSPLSLVSEAVDNHLAVPVPHYYALHEVAQAYLAPDPPPKILDLYRDPLTNIIPSERIHELWTRHDDWKTTLRRIEDTSALKTLALQLLTDKLCRDANVQLAKSIAPELNARAVKSATLDAIKATPEALMWHEFTRLNAAIAEVETQMFYALPPGEREARFGAAHLHRRLSGEEEQAVLQTVNATLNLQLSPAPDLWVYTLSPYSRDIKIKPGDFAWALSPRDENLFLNRSALYGNPPRLPNVGEYCDSQRNQSIGGAGLTQVALEAIDRQNGFIVLRADANNRVLEMEKYGDADFRQDVMLDQLAADFMTGKVRTTLKGIGQPLNAPSNADILERLRRANIKPQSRGKKHIEAHDFLYEPHNMVHKTVPRSTSLPMLRAQFLDEGAILNPSQWKAWEQALSQRLCLIWGPPGTGKSETLRAIIRSAVRDARNENQPLRLLITANNYTAVDNVLLELETHFRGQAAPVQLFRLQSKSRGVDPKIAALHPALCNIELDKNDPCDATLKLRELLDAPSEIVIVGTVAHQIYNLAAINDKGINAQIKEWFDFVVLDEASQMDVAVSTLVFSKVAPAGACVLAGDDLQLPPIQQAEAPQGLEPLVGSVYSFMRGHHGIEPCPLSVNYRSNKTIVDFTIEAGYKPTLKAHAPDLKLHLTSTLPNTTSATPPDDWPSQIPFSPDWARLLDPEKPLTCFLYSDEVSGQSNAFEAQAVAALIHLLHGRLASPLNGRDHDGQPVQVEAQPYTASEFWRKGIGVVAPHRAQGSRITDLLRHTFKPATGATSELINAAVDTVERFQGQQRDVIFASFGLGDPEVIANEDEFLYDLRRFNVMVSRARVKVIVLMSRSVFEHLSNDQKIVSESALLKHFVESSCSGDEALQLPFYDDEGTPQTRVGILRGA